MDRCVVAENEERGVLASMVIEGHENDVVAFVEENEHEDVVFSIRKL